VRRKQSVSSIAANFGVSASDVRRWNRISSRTRTVRAGRHLVIWGDGPSASVAVREPPLRSSGDGIPERTGWKLKSHKVRRGETVASIARRYGVTPAQLVEWNGLSSGKLKSGKRIYVSSPSEGRPENSTLPVAVARATPEPRLQALAEAELMAEDEDEAAVENRSRNEAPASSPRPTSHRVRRGETLVGLSARFRVDVDDLRAWNNLRSDRLRTGMRLRLQGETRERASAGTSDRSRSPARVVRLSADPDEDAVGRTHRIAPGETLESIARKYGVAVSSLKILNRLRNSRIAAGQKLSIPAAAAAVDAPSEARAAPAPVRRGPDRTATVRYVVREGDSLYSIARARSTTVDTLMLLNGLSTAGIRAGQVIEVPLVASR
jgi:membrane-bound lytic murein transglycosylase D